MSYLATLPSPAWNAAILRLPRPKNSGIAVASDRIQRQKAGYRAELAWTCCDYAGTLLQRKQSGVHEKAMSLQDESPDTSWACGP